jgi:glycosyltransferase involved in cell wall biosynthesis
MDFPQRLVMCIAQFIGYYIGIRSRVEVDRRREKTLKGTFFILSGVPIDDTGGGARCTQIALELLRRQYGVVFINKYPKYESQDLGSLINHPNLYTSTLQGFAIDQFIHRHPDLFKSKPVGVLVEFPLGEFIDLLNTLREYEAVVIYDLLDAWDTSLGAQWYLQKNELEIIKNSNILAATAPALATRLEQLSGRPVVTLPNAVNLYLFDHRRKWSRPVDLPQADWSMIYIGALWGEWFDWDLLIEVAQRFPEANVIVIGDYRGQCPAKLANLHFLGLKPQKTLPAYLAHSDLVIIPWKINPITLATSPIKVYEALAMRKPVVVPDLPILKDLPFVISSRDSKHFTENIVIARSLEPDEVMLEAFAMDNSWQRRVDCLTQMMSAQPG